MTSPEVTDIKLHMLETITDQFSEQRKIGSGGYGEVFMGVLNGDEIAVKKLYPVNGLDDENFTNEFRHLMKVKHENIVRLIGYCYEIRHKHTEHKDQLVFAQVIDRALCFEYMPGGSLAKHISDESCIHDWATTYKIIKGTCKGLHYLHKGRGEGNYIYHLDLKPDNILLDKNMIPKVTDFGLSKLFGESKTYQTSIMKGTRGFMPPEYIQNGTTTPKNDVFSLGVVIFYMMAGQKGYNDYCDSPSLREEFIHRVQEYWKKRMHATADDTWDEINLLGVVKKCIEIAMSCVETKRADRPTTEYIIDELNKLDAHMEKMSKKDQRSIVVQRNLDCRDIAVDPSLELRFPFKPKRDVSCCLQLTNNVNHFIAFNIKTDQKKYCAQPNKGIMPPSSKPYITITLQAQEKAPPNMQCLDKFIVQSTRVSEDFTSEEITEYFVKNATAVDEVTLPIAYVALE